jgi:hypothetical protein
LRWHVYRKTWHNPQKTWIFTNTSVRTSQAALHQLTFKSLAVSLPTTRFNIQKFYMVLVLRWVFCTDLRTQRPLFYTSLTEWFL